MSLGQEQSVPTVSPAGEQESLTILREIRREMATIVSRVDKLEQSSSQKEGEPEFLVAPVEARASVVRDGMAQQQVDNQASNTAMLSQQSSNEVPINASENHRNLPQMENAYAAAQPAPPPNMAGATLADLRRDNILAQAAAQRWMELDFDDGAPNDSADNLHSFWSRGKKSGSDLTASDRISRYIDWPHFHIYRGYERLPVRYKELTVAEFSHGYMQMIKNPRNRFDHELMLGLLSDLLEDAVDWPWEQVRNAYRIIAAGVERAKYTWTDTQTIRELRVKYVRTPIPRSTNSNGNGQAPSKYNRVAQTGARTCALFNDNSCNYRRDHGAFLHACSYCHRNRNMLYYHSEADCRQKTGFVQRQPMRRDAEI